MNSPSFVEAELEGQQGEADARPWALRSKPVRLALAVVALTVLGGGVAAGAEWWMHGRFVVSTNDAFLQADQVSVAPRVAGYVEEVLVADNQAVVPGQPLARIDARNPEARMDQAKAQIDQGKAAIRQAETQIEGQRAQIAQAEAQAAGARAAATYAQAQVDRYAPLVASGVETAEHLDQLRQSRDQSAAQAKAAAAQVLAARRQVDTLKAQIGVAQAQMEQSQAQARQAQTDVEAVIVRASIAGRIGDRTVRPGQYVQPGTRLMSVVPVQAIYLTANFKETQIGRMRPGQPVEVKVDALGGRTIRGVVDSFAPGTGAQFALLPPNNATGNFTKIVQRVPVRIRVDMPPELRPVLLPGLSVAVAVDTRARANAADEASRTVRAG